MTKLNELNLGENDQIRSEIIKLFSTWKDIRPDSVDLRRRELFDNIDRQIYIQLDLLAKNSPADFRRLLSADVDQNHEEFSYSILFSRFLNSQQQRKDIFLTDCSASELVVYVQRNCLWLKDYSAFEGLDKSHNASFAKIKSFISDAIPLINKHKALDANDADMLRVMLIKLLVRKYQYLNPNNAVEINKTTKTQDRDYCIKQIHKILDAINNVNIEDSNRTPLLKEVLDLNDYKNEHPDLMKNMLYSLLERGVEIKNSLVTIAQIKICGNEDTTYEFLSAALDKNKLIPINKIKEALDKAVKYGNAGAIRALYENLSKNNYMLEKFAYTELISQPSCAQPEEINGVLTYLSISNSSVSEMLEDVVENQPQDKQKFLENLLGESSWHKGKDYARYEESEHKNIFYYYAQQPERCLEKTDFYKDFATTKMIIKSDPEICPLNLAIKTHNVNFLLFALDVMEFKVSKQLANKIIAGTSELIDQGVDIKNIITQLESSVSQYSRPNRWMSSEYKILSAIQNKIKPSCLLWQSRKPKLSSEQENKQRLALT